MSGRVPRLTDRALPWRATCSDSMNRLLTGRWRFGFTRAFAMNGSSRARMNCGSRSRGTLYRRMIIFRFAAKRRGVSHRGTEGGEGRNGLEYPMYLWDARPDFKLEIGNVKYAR